MSIGLKPSTVLCDGPLGRLQTTPFAGPLVLTPPPPESVPETPAQGIRRRQAEIAAEVRDLIIDAQRKIEEAADLAQQVVDCGPNVVHDGIRQHFEQFRAHAITAVQGIELLARRNKV